MSGRPTVVRLVLSQLPRKYLALTKYRPVLAVAKPQQLEQLLYYIRGLQWFP